MLFISRLRIAFGGLRQRQAYRFRSWRAQPQIRRAAAPTVAALREIKMKLPSNTPLLGILLAEHFGDVVASEPVLSYLKSRYPHAGIVWLTKPMYASLVAAHPAVHAVVALNSISEARAVISSGCLDQAYDLHLPGKPCTQFKLSYSKTTGDPTITTDNYFDYGPLLTAFSRSAGLPALESAPQLYIGPGAQKKIDRFELPPRFVVIHGRSNQPSNNWDPSHWPRLIDALHTAPATRQFAVVEVGLESVLPPDYRGRIDLCGRLSAIETAEVISRAEGFIGIDSGPAHCANALRIPSVIMLGQYKSFVRYMPYTGYFRDHEDDMLLRSPTCARDLSMEAVFSRFQHVLQISRRAPCLVQARETAGQWRAGHSATPVAPNGS